MTNNFIKDVGQIFSIMSLEMRKYLSGKKFAGMLLLIVAIVIVISVFPLLVGQDYPSTSGEILSNYTIGILFMVFLPLIVIISAVSATIFSATSLNSEYEEKTGLLLFSKPIRKGSIVIGKFLAAFLVSTVVILIYYAIVMILSLCIVGSVEQYLWHHIIPYTIPYVFAATGAAFFFSALFKKGSNSTLISLAILLMVDFVHDIMVNAEIIDGYWFNLFYADGIIIPIIGSPDPLLSPIVMFGWGFFAVLFTFLIYRRRNF